MSPSRRTGDGDGRDQGRRPAPFRRRACGSAALILLLGGCGTPEPAADAGLVGTWAVDVETARVVQRQDMARTLSLPYVDGNQIASGAIGVVQYDRERVSPGVNLYSSGHAPEAYLMDLEGRPLYRWRYPHLEAFPAASPNNDAFSFRRVRLLDDGSLLVLYQSGGLVRLGPDSELVWARPEAFFNDLTVDAEGRIWSIVKEAVDRPGLIGDGPVLEDFLLQIDLERGEALRRFSLLDALLESPFAGELRVDPRQPDVLHTNTVELLDGVGQPADSPLRAGTALVSFRHQDLLAVVDLEDGRITWARRGIWKRQHDPHPRPGGRILLFDNLGYEGAARLLEVDASSGARTWQFPPEGEPPVESPMAGTVTQLPNGNLLGTVSYNGRAIEITPDGDVVWAFVSPHRTGEKDLLVAALWEVQRIPELPSAIAERIGGRSPVR